jgi:Mg/Co/Ni transporter MgtE
MGFNDVYDYAAGKANWIAMGLPTERRDTQPRIEQVARKDVPTCGVHDRLSQVRAKLPEGWNVCVVLNADRIVLGLVDFFDQLDESQSIEEVMRPAPLTFRPGRPVAQVCEYLETKNVPVALITTSAGQFIGILRRDELCQHQ